MFCVPVNHRNSGYVGILRFRSAAKRDGNSSAGDESEGT